MIWIESGSFVMGSNLHQSEERPARNVHVDGFWIDRTPVTNREFAQFVAATGYLTIAERVPEAALYPGADAAALCAGSLVFVQPTQAVSLDDPLRWWCFTPGACWLRPRGAGSSVDGLDQHPVVHVTYEDAAAYASWSGKELPSEAEWEFAARGGLAEATYAWGDEFAPQGRQMANTWQGEFPWQNLAADGYERTSPVGAYPANAYGLVDMTGNVWEWTSDWFVDQPRAGWKQCCTVANPRGPDQSLSFEAADASVRIPRKVVKGGSFLCAPSYCDRYRPSARQPQMIDTSSCHIGFRCVSRASTRN